MANILVVVDMQNNFVDGPLGTKESQWLATRLADYIKNYNGIVMATKETLHASADVPFGRCIESTPGWQLNPEISDALCFKGDDFVSCIFKPTFGSFELIDKIADYLDSNNDAIELCGLHTGTGVLSNAIMLRSAYPDVRIVVDSKFTECVSDESKKNALNAMKLCQIEVVE